MVATAKDIVFVRNYVQEFFVSIGLVMNFIACITYTKLNMGVIGQEYFDLFLISSTVWMFFVNIGKLYPYNIHLKRVFDLGISLNFSVSIIIMVIGFFVEKIAFIDKAWMQFLYDLYTISTLSFLIYKHELVIKRIPMDLFVGIVLFFFIGVFFEFLIWIFLYSLWGGDKNPLIFLFDIFVDFVYKKNKI